jgi:hypothetical protein
MLVVERKRWIEELDELIDQHLENDMCLTNLAKIDLESTNGKLSNFFTATIQRFSVGISLPILQKYY